MSKRLFHLEECFQHVLHVSEFNLEFTLHNSLRFTVTEIWTAHGFKNLLSNICMAIVPLPSRHLLTYCAYYKGDKLQCRFPCKTSQQTLNRQLLKTQDRGTFPIDQSLSYKKGMVNILFSSSLFL